MWGKIIGCHLAIAASVACVTDNSLSGHLQDFERIARSACLDASGLLTAAVEWQDRQREISIATMRQEGADSLLIGTGETLESIHDPWRDLAVARSFATLLPVPSHVDAYVLPVQADGVNQFYTGWVDLYFNADLAEGPRFLQLRAVWLTDYSWWDDAPTHYFFLQGPTTDRRQRPVATSESVCSQVKAELVSP